MNIDFNALKAQLTPGWTPVNIVITILAFLIFWPVGLLMIGYILKGADFGLNLAQPSTFMPFFRDVGDSLRETTSKFSSKIRNSSSGSQSGGRPVHQMGSKDQSSAERESFETWRQKATDTLREERQALEKDKAEFAAQKRKYEESL